MSRAQVESFCVHNHQKVAIATHTVTFYEQGKAPSKYRFCDNCTTDEREEVKPLRAGVRRVIRKGAR